MTCSVFLKHFFFYGNRDQAVTNNYRLRLIDRKTRLNGKMKNNNNEKKNC